MGSFYACSIRGPYREPIIALVSIFCIAADKPTCALFRAGVEVKKKEEKKCDWMRDTKAKRVSSKLTANEVKDGDDKLNFVK